MKIYSKQSCPLKLGHNVKKGFLNPGCTYMCKLGVVYRVCVCWCVTHLKMNRAGESQVQCFEDRVVYDAQFMMHISGPVYRNRIFCKVSKTKTKDLKQITCVCMCVCPLLATGAETLPETSTQPQLPSAVPHPGSASLTPGSPTPTSYTVHATASFAERVEQAQANITNLKESFFDINFEAQQLLTKREQQEEDFFSKFQFYLLNMSVRRRQIHVKFFNMSENEILQSDTIKKLFIILGRHCNYTNYEITLHIVNRFCKELNEQMVFYCESLINFEKATTVRIYLSAISARETGRIYKGFMSMTMKISKPASECTLYEIRQLKESIEEEAELESYAVYIEIPGPGSVLVKLCFLEKAGWMVGVVLTPDFKQKHLLSEVTVVRQDQQVRSLPGYLVGFSTNFLFFT